MNEAEERRRFNTWLREQLPADLQVVSEYATVREAWWQVWKGRAQLETDNAAELEVTKRIQAEEQAEPFTEKQAEWVARAFWRRIYPFRNDFGRELPAQCPVEFGANMATALGALSLPGGRNDG